MDAVGKWSGPTGSSTDDISVGNEGEGKGESEDGGSVRILWTSNVARYVILFMDTDEYKYS